MLHQLNQVSTAHKDLMKWQKYKKIFPTIVVLNLISLHLDANGQVFTSACVSLFFCFGPMTNQTPTIWHFDQFDLSFVFFNVHPEILSTHLVKNICYSSTILLQHFDLNKDFRLW